MKNNSNNLSMVNDGDQQSRFKNSLQGVSKKIQSADNMDEIMLDCSDDIRKLFNAERITIYITQDEGKTIVSKIKSGLNEFKPIKLPVDAKSSLASFAAFNKKTLNIPDVYDLDSLRKIDQNLHFLGNVDEKTKFRTKQMLVSPIVKDSNLIGVVQLINNKENIQFPSFMESGLKEICDNISSFVANKDKKVNNAEKDVIDPNNKYQHLVIDKAISNDDLQEALSKAKKNNSNVEDILLKEYKLSVDVIGEALGKFYSVKYIPFKSSMQIPTKLLSKLKRDYAETNKWLPLEETPTELIVLTTDPESVKASRSVNNIYSKIRVSYVVSTDSEFKQTLERFFSKQDASGFNKNPNDSMLEKRTSSESDSELTNFVNKMVVDAYEQNASDIHIEPGIGEEKTQIRFRKDGSLVMYKEVTPEWRNSMTSRVKIMCDLDIAEKRKPQDGKIKFNKFYPQLDIELRVATIPSTGGVEDVVMRILAAGEPLPLDKLGVSPRNLQNLKSAIEKPYGLFFVCGPTGSGKTTTLHSILKHLNTTETKIWTAEDPVEITQKGLRQVQINKKAGLDFAVIMRSFLRADPDIIMVGEMRDKETTSIGIEASLTGHLVFATLHTNSAPESVTRLLDMGMDPFNFADAILGILAQRLAKRLCSCKESYVASKEEIRQMLTEYCEELLRTSMFLKDQAAGFKAIFQNEWIPNYTKDGVFTLYKPKGCDKCLGTGYKGRVGLHELMIGSDRVKKLIIEKSTVAKILAGALEDGMRTLKMDGIEKTLQGITDLKQVHAVCVK